MAWLRGFNKLSSRQLIFFLFFVGFLVYFNSLFNGFVWDDEEQIVKNPLVQNFSNLPQIFSSSTFYGGGSSPTGWFYRPMMSFSYLVNFSLWGGSAFGFHLFQVFIHLANATFIFLIFSKIFKLVGVSRFRLVAFFVALVFIVHPGNVEAVAYIAALQESLYTLFILLVFWVLLKVKSGPWDFYLIGFLTLLALLSKESAFIVFPLVTLFIFLFQKEKLFLWFVASFCSFFSYLFLRLVVAGISFSSPDVGPVAEASLGQRLTSLPYEIFSYLRIIFFPKDLFVSQHVLVDSFSDFRFWGYLLLILVLFLGWLWYFVGTRSKVFLFFSFWFVGSLGLVLNILPLDMIVAERWLYFPLIGFLGMFFVGIDDLGKRFSWFWRGGFYFFLLVVLLLGARTVVRNSNWHDGLTLYGHDILINDEAFDLENNYGVELFRVGKMEEAKFHFKRSITLYPKWRFAYNNLGAVYQREGELEKAGEFYRQAIEISDYYLAWENLGFLMLQTSPPGEVVEFLKMALSKFPQNANLTRALALAYYQDGQKAKAEAFARKAYALENSPVNRLALETILKGEEIQL